MVSCLKNFVIQDDKKLINKIFFGLEKLKLGDGKLALVKTTFSRSNFERLMEKELGKLSKTAKDLFYFFEEYGKLHNICNNVHACILENHIQKTKADMRRIFQLYFFKNLIRPQ